MRDVALVLYYERGWRYWVNAIWAAVEWRGLGADVYAVSYREPLVELLSSLLRRYRAVALGLGFLTTQLPYVLDVVRLVKRVREAATPPQGRLYLVAGGPHPTGDPLGTLRMGFDLVVYGEGEDTVVELLQHLSESPRELPRVCGTAWLEGGRVVVRRRLRYVDLDSYPPFPYWRRRFGPVEIMRGCSSACFFCQVSFMFGRPRYRSVDTVVDIARRVFSSGLRDLRFIAPNSLGYMSRDGVRPNHSALEELLSRLRRLADGYGGRVFFGSFPSEVRPDSVDKESARILKRYVDNRRVIVGGQSGSDRVLRTVHRGHTIDDVFRAVEILRSHGFLPEVDFIFGLPGEDDEDVELTIRAMERLAAMGARIHAHTFMPLPGTPFHDAPPGWVDERVRRVVAKLIGRGRAYGEWEEQEAIARMIDEYRRSGVIASRVENFKKSIFLMC